jgi:hypothetical protein|tara:strand:- start:6617 stop:6844 length:228 start_codon:yes stop_codon:yes gene_type:complete
MAIARASDVEYLGGNMSGGMCVGLTSTDKVGFFAATPVVQQSVTAPNPSATTATNEAAIVSINAALVALGLIVTT